MANYVDTLAAPTDPFVMLNEIDVSKISNIDRLKDFIYLCDAALKFLDTEFALDAESRAFANMSDEEFNDLFEAKLANRTPLSKKLASARRYRNRRQHILNQKKRADDNRVAKVIAKKMAFSKKTKTGRPKKSYNIVSEYIEIEQEPLTLIEYMWWNSKPHTAVRASETKPTKLLVEVMNRKTGQYEALDSDVATIRLCREINYLLP